MLTKKRTAKNAEKIADLAIKVGKKYNTKRLTNNGYFAIIIA